MDDLSTSLAERGEEGIRPVEVSVRAWAQILATVGWLVATIVLRVVSIATVFARQVATTTDEFLRTLADGEG